MLHKYHQKQINDKLTKIQTIMKKFKLLKTLLVLIGVLITSLTTPMWAEISYSGGMIYFADIYDVDAGYIQLCGRQGSWTGISTMSNIGHTKLYYVKDPQGSGWGGILGWEVISDDEERSNANFDSWSSCSWYSGWNEYGFNSGSTYLIVPNSASSNEGVTTSYHSTGPTAFNNSQTVEKWTSVDNGSSYSKSTSYNSGEVTISAYQMTGNGTASNTDNSATFDEASEVSARVDAAFTGEVTLTATANSGYTFVGWYDTSDGLISSSNPYVYNAPNSTKTIRARFKNETTYTITIANSVNASTSSASVGATPVQITAPDIEGYRFTTWSTMPTGVTKTSGNLTDKSIYISATKAAIVTANYAAKTRITLYYSNPSSWNTVYAYVWNYSDDSDHNAAWSSNSSQGVNITSNTITRNCKTYYYYSYYYEDHTGWNRVIFSNNTTSAQTSDITYSYSTNNNQYNNGTHGTTGSWTALPAAVSYTVTVNTENASKGTVSPTSGTANNVGCALNIQAYPTTYYLFDHWTDDANTTVASTSTNPTTVTATNNGTVTAYFKDKWCVTGSGTTGMGNWSTDVNGLTYTSGTTVRGKVSITAKGDYTFKIKDRSAASDKGWYANGETISRASNSTTTDLSTSGGNMTFKADVAGDYYFAYDVDGKDLTVTYPEAYAVTYSAVLFSGSGTACSAPSAQTSEELTVTSGDMVLDESEVTFTAAAANTGYTWRGWFTKNNPSGWSDGKVSVGDDLTYTTTLDNAGVTVYAIYTEDMHTVTVQAGSHGSITTPASGNPKTVSAGIASAASIVASPADGYYFGEWIEVGSSGNVTFTDDKNASTTVKATDDATIQANFVSSWVVGGDFNSWNMRQYGVDHFGTNASKKDTAYVEIDFAANTNIEFKIYDMSTTNWWGNENNCDASDCSANAFINYASNNKQPWKFETGRRNCGLTTAGKGTYKFAWNITDKKMSVHFPTSWTVTYGVKTFYNSDASSDATTTGGNISSVKDGDAISLTSGKYVVNGGTAVFTHSAATSGYEFDGWYSDAACTSKYVDNSSTIVIDDEAGTLTLTISENTTVYAKFAEKMTTVELSATNGKIQYWDGDSWADAPSSESVGVHTTCSIKAVPNTGYYFAGWVNTEGSDYSITGSFNSESNNNTTLSGGGAGETTGQTLTANFVELDKIYFQNIVNWTNVYVYFGPAWDTGHDPSWGVWVGDVTHYAMTRLDSKSDIWWAYIPRGYTTSPNGKIAFSDYDFPNENNFYEHNGVYRGDFNSTLDCYVPIASDPFNSTSYYSDGYWMMYGTTSGESVGYELWRYAKDEKSSSKVGDFKATADGAHTSEYVHRIDDADATYKYFVKSVGGENYASSELITSDNYEAIQLYHYNSDPKTSVTYTTEGDYTFILAQGNGSMYLTVDYPVAVGDYQLVYYTTASRTAETPDITSDVIKKAKASTAVMTSMYINKDASGVVLKLQECTSIDEETKEPVWGDVDGATGLISNFAGKTKGVYQFTITASTHTIGSIAPYAGDYYIKTDCAPGGWADYKKNVMEKNTINAENAGFDHYFCRWIGGVTTNVKCVIANDYNNAISDTLYSDAILTRSAIAYQTLPEAGNVRFSYDTKTNTLKRTYLLGSTMSKQFVELKPNEAGYVYRESGATTDIYSNTTEFGDNGNWTYIMDAYVYPGAKGGVETTYPSYEGTTQTLVATTNTLMGGTKPISDLVTYHIKLLYDFKTDYLMSAYVPSGSPVTTEINLQSDMMYERTGEGASTQLSFSGDGKLKNAKRAYGVFAFPKDQMAGQMSSWSANSYQAYKYCRYYFSFPFDVKVKDIFGVGEYGNEFIIQKYNGEKRAQIGWFMETETFWETVDINETLYANTGYSLMLDREEFNRSDGKGVWTNISDGHSIYLFFPSTSTELGTINDVSGSREVTEHLHTSGRTFDGGTKNHDITDSNWGMIGLQAYASTYPNGGTNPISKCYTYQPDGVNYNTWQVTDLTRSSVLKSMHAYMVQYAGTFNWTTVAPASPIVARHYETTTNMTVQLNLMYNDNEVDRAFVKLEEGAEKGFVLNEDLYKMVNKGKTNIYVYAGDYDVAYSTTSVESQTVEVGVIISKSGEYTFSMPKNINGTVTLIDKFEQTRTNLAIEDYEVYLNKGTINDRFELEININKVPTAIDGVEDGSLKDGKAHKFIENGVMYILKEGEVFDARGNRVK